MPMLIIQPNNTTQEAREWLVDVFVQMLDAIDLHEDDVSDLTHYAESLSYKDADTIFEYAVERLIE